MDFSVKRFEELSKEELVEIYQMRISVFVVEQQCPYQEIDGLDTSAIHVMGREDGKLLAYSHVLPAGTMLPEVAIGRVISLRRRCGIGSELMTKAIRVARDSFAAKTIQVEAQVYARPFYERQGFTGISDTYLVDGIPHLTMERNESKT